MSGIQQLLLGGSPAGYQIERSLRFNSADSAYLNRTPASAGNQKTWTWSAWVKPARFASQQPLFNSYSSVTNYGLISFSANAFYNASDTLKFNVVVSNANQLLFETSAVYRDPSAWYHIVIALDTTQATNTNRVKIYVNGVQVTAFITATYPTQNLDVGFFNTTNQHQIGALATGTYGYFSGYMTEMYFIDGQALTPSDFGETDSATGVWKPKKFSGTYGTNGFYLNFSDNSNTTAATLGKDSSGNGNNWTPNNFSVTAGAGNDSLVDTPTSYGTDTGVGGEVRGNYCTLNPLDSRGGNTTSDGNLKLGPTTGTTWKVQPATMAVSSGKWYFEVVQTAVSNANNFACGFVPVPTPVNSYTNLPSSVASAEGWSFQLDSTSTLYFWYGYSGSPQYVTISTSFGTSDVAQIAVDIDAGKIWVGKNNTWYNSSGGTTGNPATGANATATNISGTLVPFLASLGTTTTGYANFGQRPFAYTAPSGFKALCTQNLPTPTIGATSTTQAGKYMNVVLYTGNGSTQSITGVGFQPDLVWYKRRNTSDNNRLFDAVRGVTKPLFSDLTSAESTESGVTAFNSDGFSLGSAGNELNNTYVAWNWKANGSGSSNTSGSITSTVSANTTAGFSIVTYTGTGANATVGHGLGVAPRMFITKNRDSGTPGWAVYHASVGNTGALALNATTAVDTNSVYFNNTTPTSTVFSVGTGTAVNTNTQKYVAYCFAEVAGYSAFGSYTGNGSTDGPFVYTGFRPKFILFKANTAGQNWIIFDTARSTYNVTQAQLYPNLSNAEDSSRSIDVLSNGFKIRDTSAGINSGTIIYAAFAESPFKYSLAR